METKQPDTEKIAELDKLERERARLAQFEEDANKILSLKSQGWNDHKIRLELGLVSPDSFKARLKYIRENDLIKERAAVVCEETILRLMDTRQRLLSDYAEFRKNNNLKYAYSAIQKVINIDQSIPAICIQLGFMQNPEHKVEVYLNTEKNRDLSKEEIIERYRASFDKYRPTIKPVN